MITLTKAQLHTLVGKAFELGDGTRITQADDGILHLYEEIVTDDGKLVEWHAVHLGTDGIYDRKDG